MLPDHFSPDNMGLIIPKTRDGRVLFFLPWEGEWVIIGVSFVERILLPMG